MRNTGMLFANDANPDRAKAVVGNLHRLGVTNCVVSNYDGRLFPKVSVPVLPLPLHPSHEFEKKRNPHAN